MSDVFDTMKDISDAVSDAAQSGNFSGLNHRIRDSVSDFANGVGDTVANGARDFADTVRGAGTQNRSAGSGADQAGSGSGGSESGRYSGSGSSRTGGQWYAGSSGQRTGRYTAFGNHQTNLHEGDAVYESAYRKGNATDEEIERIRREKMERSRQQGGRQTVVDENGRTVGNGSTAFLQTRPNRNAGLGKRLAGVGLGAIFGISALFWLTGCLVLIPTGSGAAGVVAYGILAGVNAGITVPFVRMAKKGFRQRELAEKYYRFARLVGDGEYFSIKELADQTGETQDQVRKDIRDMHELGMLPYAKVDRAGTTVMLTQNAYEQYVQAEESFQERSASAGRADGPSGEAGETIDGEWRNVTADAGAARKNALSPEVQKILDDGNAYIREVRRINDEIPDTEEMSTKLYRLEDIMKRIFAQVEKEPSKAKDIRKLMNYYLPTTMKLLNAYVDLNNQPEAGDNIRSAKQEIDASMDTINDAFEKLLDNLFQDQAWDISSDLDVMKTMMAQDGLTEDKTEKKE